MFKVLINRLLGRPAFQFNRIKKPLRDSKDLTKLYGYPPSVRRPRVLTEEETRAHLAKRFKEISANEEAVMIHQPQPEK